jgi:sugar lactone lactonase YvrE
MYNQSGLRRFAGVCLATAALASACLAVDTHVWQQDDQAEFSHGTIKNLSIRSDGKLTLAPAFHELLDAGMTYLWSVVQDSHGKLYCAGGAPTGSTTKILAVTPQGKSDLFAELSALEVHALALDSKDRLYAATSPDAKIYRISKAGKPELFFDPKAKYIWAMAFDRSGNLFVATGDQGIIYKVTPEGKGTEFFNTEETHARSMIIDEAGDLIVGTEPGGYIVRITPQGKSFVLFQTGKREVTAVAEHNGSFYAAAAGGKPVQPTGAPAPPAPAAPATPTPAPSKTTVAVQPSAPTGASNVHALTPPASSAPGGADFYRVQPDGFAQKLWTSPTDVIYAIGFDANGKPLLGTGNKGLIYRIDSAVLSTALLNAPPTQVTSFAPGRDGVLYATTGNVGKLYAIGPGLETSGFVESEVLDAGSFAYWGKAHVPSDVKAGSIDLSTRSGNLNRPQKNWSDWSKVDLSPAGGQVHSPAARFLQYRLALNSEKGGEYPEVNAVQIAYLPKNIAPEVRQIEIAPENYRTSSSALLLERTVTASGSPSTLSLPPLGQKKNQPSPASPTSSAVTLQYAKGFITARWDASDANGDPLVYKVELRGEQERQWHLLKDKLTETQLSFDGSAFADGRYYLRVTASDLPANTPKDALTNSLDSESFVIDNTPPELKSTGVKNGNEGLTLHFTARDTLSWISKAEYSVDGSEWTAIDPENKVSDSQSLEYDLKLPRFASADQHTIAVRVFDDADNVTVERYFAQ